MTNKGKHRACVQKDASVLLGRQSNIAKASLIDGLQCFIQFYHHHVWKDFQREYHLLFSFGAG